MEKAGRQTDILGSACKRCAVADPLSRRRDDGLLFPDVEHAPLVFHTQRPAKDDGDFFELRPLTGLLPALGRPHARDTHASVPAVHTTGIFLDPLRFVSRRLDNRGADDHSWHQTSVPPGHVLVAVRGPRPAGCGLRAAG